MILTCPACATSYFVPDNAIPASGRRVRCKSCGNDWRAVNEDAPLDLGDVADATASGPATQADIPIEETELPQPLPQAFRARAEQKRRTQLAVRQGLAWGLTGVLVLIGVFLAYLWRDSVVARVPKLASAYKVLGISTNPFGLEFEAVSTGFARNDVTRVYVSGAVRNVRNHEIVVPPIRIGVLDAQGREISHRIVRIDAAPVLPGKVEGFAEILPNIDGRFAEATLSFVREETRSAPVATAPEFAPAKADPQPVPAPKTAASTQPDAAKQAAKSDSADGLRRISQLTPESSIGRTDLDTRSLVGLSAGHG